MVSFFSINSMLNISQVEVLVVVNGVTGCRKERVGGSNGGQ